MPNIASQTEEYKEKTVPRYYELFAKLYAKINTGPYLLGDKPTYADFAVFQVLDNDAVIGAAPVSYPTHPRLEILNVNCHLRRALCQPH